ncbi:TetR/AcrR family transcriptional regulator [Leifsonia sp. A12D58]|uniref:TetR/AcrR family transcriptional regulator n=1 Tax=Leifsonia sp. A12D58 TaxID=3397674 RepID=UPI0039DFE8A1
MSETKAERPVSAERIPAIQRREQILAAASEVFGERGYAGATTDQVAQAAGISQPYVVRMFGTKENLFIEVLERALDKLTVAYRSVLAEPTPVGETRQSFLGQRLGETYVDLIEDRGILLSIMQGFVAGHEPVIGARARAGFLSIYRLLRDEAGFDANATMEFLAQGMLFNTLLALRLPDSFNDDDTVEELMRATFTSKLDLVIGVSQESENHA